MNNYSELTDIETDLHVKLVLEPVGWPEVCVQIGKNNITGIMKEALDIECKMPINEPFSVEIELFNKEYKPDQETAIKIKMLSIDNTIILPGLEHQAQYVNDQNYTNPTNYLGFNGKWTLTFDRPFYQWLHQISGQGWLLE